MQHSRQQQRQGSIQCIALALLAMIASSQVRLQSRPSVTFQVVVSHVVSWLPKTKTEICQSAIDFGDVR